MGIELTFHVELGSDYHISAGHGSGAGIDSSLLREGDGAPVLRGTTLVGLLRDGLWRLMQLAPLSSYRCCEASGLQVGKKYCGQFGSDEEVCPLCRLFGTPRSPKQWQVSSARPLLAPQVGAAGGISRLTGRTPTQVVQRARISPRTRRAQPRHLFSQEEGDARLVFTFTIRGGDIRAETLDEAALWMAAARNVRQMGRSRRRGQGECLFTLKEIRGADGGLPADSRKHQEWLLDRLKLTWLGGKAKGASLPGRKLPAASKGIKAEDRSSVRMRLIARLDEPVIIANRAEVGHQYETLPFITGQTLRGALAWLASSRFDLSDSKSEVYAQFVRTFVHGEVTFPVLYPAVLVSGHAYSATIPAPRNLLSCKTMPGLPNQGHGLHGGLEDPPQYCTKAGCESPLQSLDGFMVIDKSVWSDRHFLIPSERRSELHVCLDPETGRSSEGKLYGYVALEAGQYFVGELKCAGEAAWAALQDLTALKEKTPSVVRLGKACRRGYGQATLWLEKLNASVPLTWIQQTLDTKDANRVSDAGNITITLLTDTIIIDTWGRPANTFDSRWLSKALSLSVEIIPNSIYVRTRIVDGFNAHLGLPRWRDIAIAAGSAVRVRLIDPPGDWRNRLAAVESEGIGLRRNEGFGQVAFNHPVYLRCSNIESTQYELDPKMRLGGTDSSGQTSFGHERRWRETLDGAESRWRQESGAVPGHQLDERFTAVARWLHEHSHTPPQELAGQMSELGQPDKTLKTIIKDYGDREAKPGRENKIQAQAGAVRLIGELLGKLSREPEAFWSQGIRMLAERLAGSTDRKGRNP